DIPLIRARFRGKSGLFAVDTGNAGNLIIQGRWALANGFDEDINRASLSTTSGTGGESQVRTGGGGEFEIGGLELHDLTTTWAHDKYGAFSSKTEAGNVGAEVLANFTVEFDYANQMIWFEAIPGWTPPRRRTLGATISKR